MKNLIRLRRDLHRLPELSGREEETAARIHDFFRSLNPDLVLTGLGGHGLAFVFKGAAPGPTLLLRCDLDALPITESNDFPHASVKPGVSHKCGHDGHMAILAAVGEGLAARRPDTGRVVLLYQPAEETGRGAAAVCRDPRFERIRPDHVFALHNLPGFPLGEVVVRAGTFSCASTGLLIELKGVTAHAAQPETGRSPAGAVTRIIAGLEALGDHERSAFATVTGAKLGVEETYGTTPGEAAVWGVLRAETDESLAGLVEKTTRLAVVRASADDLELTLSFTDRFPATVNSAAAVAAIRRAAGTATVTEIKQPFRWSEDFGHFTAVCEGALFGLGAGRDTPDLHHPAYDFPDELIAPGAAIFLNLVKEILGRNPT